ncbi:unnamed protein product [Rotaria sordida]|uniref:Ubiquitin-like domain-containing protein n=1 Tax=Rotaria sordida TaxID=392033 RepID=A0A814JCL7_9BILA|nr:unnamed protein product [Rotaria sordida]CAF1060283.1 unnamed protein product [Rotaria sordida]CAF1101006.1 unnamed protein product [Rotaria sordida]CAF3701769.1 unnamed protein product [Rotaria sordida]CAF3716431.1 unnamed protein product [Rotaria sordida]
MERRSFSDVGKISITVEISPNDGQNEVTLANIPLCMTIGDLKQKLNVEPNSRLGRPHEFENWDNRRQLSDYFVKDYEQLVCVLQCIKEDGQSSCDDYDQWLAKRTNSETK